jgi:hypothetical protein
VGIVTEDVVVDVLAVLNKDATFAGGSIDELTFNPQRVT